MKNANILRTVRGLRAHVRDRLRRNPDADEQQLVHRFLAALDLTATDHRAILDEYRRQELGVRDKSMTEKAIVPTIVVLEYCVSEKLRQNPDASEEQLVHDHLAALNLEPTDHAAILATYRLRVTQRTAAALYSHVRESGGWFGASSTWPDANEAKLMHDYLEALNLEPTQLRAVLHEYRRLRSGSINPWWPLTTRKRL